MANKLARDVESVALPILNFSPSFSDEDLMEIVRLGGPVRQVAIAKRPQLSDQVTSTIVKEGVEEAVKTVCANDNADIAERTLQKVIERFEKSERVLASVLEAVLGACFLHSGYELTAAAVVEAFEPELQSALANPVDFKSALQERLARRQELVTYVLSGETGPPHDRTFEVTANAGDRLTATGTGRSKKQAEQDAARRLLEDPAL